jgi:hypothetical protein
LACRYTVEKRYFVSESRFCRILKSADLITSPAKPRVSSIAVSARKREAESLTTQVPTGKEYRPSMAQLGYPKARALEVPISRED